MRKNRIILFLIVIITLTAVFFAKREEGKKGQDGYLRIHVRANSNDYADQNVKYCIKDKIVDFLTPYVAECTDKKQAVSLINKKAGLVTEMVNGVLLERGFDYGAKISVKREYFPTRVYQNYTLSAGYYDAVIVELGQAVGDNWWCVVYPPLCFVNSQNITYRSKVAEIIRRFYKDRT